MSASLVRRAAASAVASPTAPSAEIKTVQYPYFVARHATSGRLPVYNQFRAGIATTLVRNVDGDTGALRDDLRASLFRRAKQPPQILIRHGKHVEIEGTWRESVARWLMSRGS
ncbi:hypothetical protein FRC06_009253 [Ceratobasidium sp. 370]|nr:hypothetical protein FRC06_009253 [Ceratobasidium sp. 370]